MKPHIVADGRERLESSPEIQAKLQAVRESIQDQYKTELNSATGLQQLVVRWKIFRAYQRESRRILPSSHALYIVPPR